MFDAEGKSWTCPACHASIDSSGTYSLAYNVGRHIRDHERVSRNAALQAAGVQTQSRSLVLSRRVQDEDEHVEPSRPWNDSSEFSELDTTLLYCAHVLWDAPEGYPACKP